MFVSRQTTTRRGCRPASRPASKGNGLSPKGDEKTSEQHKKVPAYAGMRGRAGMRGCPQKTEWLQTIPYIICSLSPRRLAGARTLNFEAKRSELTP